MNDITKTLHALFHSEAQKTIVVIVSVCLIVALFVGEWVCICSEGRKKENLLKYYQNTLV